MIKIKLNNEVIDVPKGTPLLNLIPKNEQKKYYTCLVNDRIRELSFKISFDAEIKFLDFSHIESMKAYEASIRYLVAKAFYELYKDVSIKFSYNVSRSILVKSITKGFHIDKTVVSKIEAYIEELIKQDIPIERVTFDREEGTKMYHKFNLSDKLDILKYRPLGNIHLYKCGDYYNYMHSYMLPSTGFIGKFIFRLQPDGIIIQYPRTETNGEIPQFEQSRVYALTLDKATQWAKRINADTISKINDYANNKDTKDLIQICETRHNNMLAELGDIIESNKDYIRLIAIAGPSSSGKTTFSNRLRVQLMSRGINPVTLSIDNYYIDRDKIALNENGELDLEDINTIDVELFNQHLVQLINGETVDMPIFDFNVAKRTGFIKVKIPENVPIIIEGIHALNERMSESIPAHQKFKIFISPQIQLNIDNHSPISTTDIRLIRRIVRDKQFRNASAEHTLSMWNSVRSGEFKWIYPHQESCNYVYNSELTYELGVLKKYAIPLLKEIKSDSPYYITANRLIKYLKYFIEIDEEAIPCNSLIREFIGGSCFEV